MIWLLSLGFGVTVKRYTMNNVAKQSYTTIKYATRYGWRLNTHKVLHSLSLGPWRPQVTASSSCSLAWSWSQRLICCEKFPVWSLVHLFISSLGIGPLSSLQLHFVLSTGDLYKHFLYQLSSLSFCFRFIGTFCLSWLVNRGRTQNISYRFIHWFFFSFY